MSAVTRLLLAIFNAWRRHGDYRRRVSRSFQAYCEARDMPVYYDDWRDWSYNGDLTRKPPRRR